MAWPVSVKIRIVVLYEQTEREGARSPLSYLSAACIVDPVKPRYTRTQVQYLAFMGAGIGQIGG